MHWKSVSRSAGLLCCLSAAASAQWADNFDSYVTGSVINGQGGWQQWDNVPNTTSVVSSTFARSAPNSVGIFSTGPAGSLTSDLVQRFFGYTSGAWTMRAWAYVPGPAAPNPLTEKIYFLILSIYNDGGPYDWTVDVELDPAVGQWHLYPGSVSTISGPLLVDQWVELRAEIDFTADTVECFYNGASMAPPFSWTGGVFGAGTAILNIAALDLYHQPAANPLSGGYYDDVSLTAGGIPLPTTYCTAKTNSLGCTPSIGFSGAPSASALSGFNVTATLERNNKNGLLFYGVSGQSAVPFQGGTLCVKTPIRRTGAVNSGGTPPPANDCSGVFSIDMNAFAHQPGPPAPLPALLVVGTVVDCQWWGRDPGFAPPNNTTLSNGLEYVVQP